MDLGFVYTGEKRFEKIGRENHKLLYNALSEFTPFSIYDQCKVDRKNDEFKLSALNQIWDFYKALPYVKERIVVRMRTDSMIHNKIQYESFPKDVVFYSGSQNQPDGMINDWFNFGGSKVMDVFMSAFPMLDHCIDECNKQTNGAWCCELIHRKIIDFFNIIVVKIYPSF